jgi:glycosyltransferase involved in cell wall biosynthesis
MATDQAGVVSVVITAYQCARYLAQAIDSVLAQTQPAQQIIVVDDGSTDACARVVQDYGSRVTYVRQDNQGAGPARNTGIRLANGDWVALLDGDDYWVPTKLAEQLAAAVSSPRLEAVFGHMHAFVSPELDAAEQARLRAASAPAPGYCASTLMIQRAAFWRVGAFPEQYHVGEFVEWYGRALDAGLAVEMLPTTLAWRRLHANNTTRLRRDQRGDYAHALKSMLDRRRAAQRTDGD